MDVNKFQKCLKNNQFNGEIQNDYAEASEANITSTPSFLINGKMVVGNAPLDKFETLIQSELENASLVP
jgi:protein-disulfide isomerase